jgi:hypothetical protein
MQPVFCRIICQSVCTVIMNSCTSSLLTSHAPDVQNKRKRSEGHLSEENSAICTRVSYQTIALLTFTDLEMFFFSWMNINFTVSEYMFNFQKTQSCLLLAGWLCLLFNPEDGGCIFLWYVQKIVLFIVRTLYPTSYPFSCYFCTGNLLEHVVAEMK